MPLTHDSTITGPDWQRQLRKARARRLGTSIRVLAQITHLHAPRTTPNIATK